MANDHAISREKRELPPTHYTIEIKSYIQLFRSTRIERYESGIFEAGGYKWRLVFYPDGNKKDGGHGHISLYLKIDKSNAFSDDWRVHVNYKLFVQDRKHNNFFVIQDAKGPVRRFDRNKTEWGFGQFLTLESFNEPLNGYLIDDSCVFGAEIFVIETTGKGESIFILKDPPGGTHTWKIKNFSKLDETVQWSDIFTVGDRKWRLKLYPLGIEVERGNFLSLYFELTDLKSLPHKRAVCAELKLRLLDQLHRVNLVEKKYNHWFTAEEDVWGYKQFISLKNLHKISNGYVVDDILTVEVQILSMSEVKEE